MRKKKKKTLTRLFEALLTVVLLAGAGVAVYFMVTDPEGTIAQMDRVIPWGRKKGETPEQEPRARKEASSKRTGRKSGLETPEREPGAKGGGETISAPKPATHLPLHTSTTSAAILKKAGAYYLQMEYERALAELDRLIPGTLCADDLREVDRLENRSGDFLSIIDGIKPLELADGKGIVKLHLSSGRSVEGRILKQESGIIHLQKNHGIRWPVRAEQVDRIEKIPRQEIMDRREKAFKKARGGTKSLTPVRAFELVEHCIREGLRYKVTGLLEKGMAMDLHFPQTVYNEKAKRVYLLYLWYKGKKKEKFAAKQVRLLVENFPQSHFTAKAREDEKISPPRVKPPPRPKPPRPPSEKPPKPLPPKSPLEGFPVQPGPEPEPRPPPPDTTGKDLLDLAEKAYRTARRHEENSFPGRPNADRENKLAIETFERAINLYEEAQRKYPDKAAFIEERLQDCLAALFWCKKRQTLD